MLEASPIVISLCATKNRFTHMRKLIRCFLEQDYPGKHYLLIYNNSTDIQSLGEFPMSDNKEIILINNYISKKTGKPYTQLGDIYNDILSVIDILNPEVVSLFEDDDLYLPNHVSEGVKGLQKGGKNGYKPQKSWFIDTVGMRLQENVMEPSVFLKYSYIKERGYGSGTADAHLHWYGDLRANDDLFVDPEGYPTFLYDWSNRIPAYKVSGDPVNPENFENCTKHSQDIGSGVLTPISREELAEYEPNYYKL